MGNVLENVSNVAVWGSLVAALVLGAFLTVQAFLSVESRIRFSTFAIVCAVIAIVDFCHASFGYYNYEKLRIIAWTLYSATLLWLFRYQLKFVLVALIGIPFVATASWIWIDPALATTAVVPVAFLIAAIVHGRQYFQTQGFGSCVLSVYSSALSILCFCYYLFLQSKNQEAIGLGYIHYAVLSCLSVLFGWIHLSRELRGRIPVRVPVIHAVSFFAVVLTCEIAIILSLLVFFQWPPYAYLALSLLQVGSLATLFFYYRHQLVIYTDNVTQLLEERTASLREAQAELSQINELQAEELTRQEKELKDKGAIIDRQRRVELAAQTAGQAAHDIQNLVSPMLTHLDRLEHGGLDISNSKKLVGLVRRQADELLELNAQLLALARRGRRDHVALDLTELIADLRERFPGRLVNIDSSPGAYIQGAWSQLSRAISNLMANAFDAMSDLPISQQKVNVRVKRVEILTQRRCHLGFLQPNTYISVEVEDSGSGISSKDLDRIFEPFFSSKNATDRSGSGLGLSIVSAVADDHHGVIDLHSSSSGTCFSLFFPAISAPSNVLQLDQLTGSERLLLVDDDESTREHYQAFLGHAGYSITCAASGDDALRMLQLEQFDLILLDLNMPGRGGCDTLFAAIHLRPGITAIVHSSFVSEQERVRLGQLGVEYFLQKPASRGEVLKLLRYVLAKNQEQKVSNSLN